MIQLNGFEWGHLKTWQFWWIFYAAIKSSSGIKGPFILGSKDGNSFLEVAKGDGAAKIIAEAGFDVVVCGTVFLATVRNYTVAN